MFKVLKALVFASVLLNVGPALAGEKDVTLYKNPQCGCCEGHADYLRQNGFVVTVKPTHDLSAMSREAGIPADFQGCHLAFVDGYVVSGHVPIGTINKLLTERPDIKGVTLPGMPLGSPGMGGTKEAPFEILGISKSGGVTGVYARNNHPMMEGLTSSARPTMSLGPNVNAPPAKPPQDRHRNAAFGHDSAR